jgi:2-haloacid dehalogenase
MSLFDPIEIISFDCYGTLIDWETGILRAVRPVLNKYNVHLADDTILETYGQIEAEVEAGPYRSYREILREVMHRLSEQHGIVLNHTEHDAIVASLPTWPPFHDTVASLKALKTKYRLAIISNIDDDLFAGTRLHLGVEFDHIVTAAQVRAYKPSIRVFEHAQTVLGCPKEAWLHAAQSLYHDHVPAQAFGLKTVWIDRRQGSPSGGATPEAIASPDLTFPDLASLVRELGL